MVDNNNKMPSALKHLESESIYIFREALVNCKRPAMLYSIGKDSSVMLHLARKAFFPAAIPFPLLHIDTTWKFKEMIAFRDETAHQQNLELLVYTNETGVKNNITPFNCEPSIYTDVMKTEALKQALDKYQFDLAFGGARRDEDKSRAKERIFSHRNRYHRWDPKAQRPELWSLYNTYREADECLRVFPLSNWTEMDIWQYIYYQDINVVPLYFASSRPTISRQGNILMVDDERLPLDNTEKITYQNIRFRSLGCYPLTCAIESTAADVKAIIKELYFSKHSERTGRLLNTNGVDTLEQKKEEGYF